MDNMRQKTIIYNKELIRAIAEDCDYNIYEVEDVFDSMVRVFTDILSKGNAIKLEHLFCIAPKIVKPQKYMDIGAKEIRMSNGSIVLSIKPSEHILNAMNPERKAKIESKRALSRNES